MIRISPVRDDADLELARVLFREYAAMLGDDVCLAGFEHELAHLDEIYGGNDGELLLARYRNEAVGCAAVRRRDADCAELKRVYLRPELRGNGGGRRLVEAAIEAARRLGYRRMVLDTLPRLETAQALYAKLGFREFEPEAPTAGLRYFELAL